MGGEELEYRLNVMQLHELSPEIRSTGSYSTNLPEKRHFIVLLTLYFDVIVLGFNNERSAPDKSEY